MMKYLPKFHISTILYILLCFAFKWYKECTLLFIIILFHEYAHFIVAKLLKYDIEGIVVYPFGAFLKIKDYGSHEIIEDLWVAMAGACSHLFLWFFSDIFLYLFGLHLYHYYIQFNLQVLLFNLLPIYPLDGFKIMHCFFSYWMDYLLSLKVMIVCSFIFFIMLVYLTFDVHYFIIYSFLGFEIYLFSQEYYYHYIKFLTQRKYNKKRKPILHDKQIFLKNRQNYYLKNGAILDEKTAIKSRILIDNTLYKW